MIESSSHQQKNVQRKLLKNTYLFWLKSWPWWNSAQLIYFLKTLFFQVSGKAQMHKKEIYKYNIQLW